MFAGPWLKLKCFDATLTNSFAEPFEFLRWLEELLPWCQKFLHCFAKYMSLTYFPVFCFKVKYASTFSWSRHCLQLPTENLKELKDFVRGKVTNVCMWGCEVENNWHVRRLYHVLPLYAILYLESELAYLRETKLYSKFCREMEVSRRKIPAPCH